MSAENLAYALVQVVHNFGAAVVVGAAVFAVWPAALHVDARRRLARWILAAWLVQAASGASFGAVSYAYYGQFPDLHGIAVAALLVKIGCAIVGIALAASWLRGAGRPASTGGERTWTALAAAGVLALTAAAFLRWFS